MLDSLNCSVLPADSSLESKPPLWSAQQRYTVQIIQLVECQPPPRRISIDNPSFASSSSCHSSPESTSSSSIDEESLCSSYCSSDDGAGVSPPLKDEVMEDARMVTRILAWRQNFSSHLPTVADASLTLSSKQQRDSDYHNNDHDAIASKRSRSHASSSSSSVLSVLSCPACDSFFDDQRGLQEHGQEEGASEACTVAVQYALESPGPAPTQASS